MNLKSAALTLLLILGSALNGCASTSSHANSEVKRLLAPTGSLRVALYAGTPTSVLSASDLRGVGYDLGKELARRLGVPFEPLVFPKNADVLDAIRQGRADVAFTNASAERAKGMDFTAPYLLIELSYIATANAPVAVLADIDRPGVRVGVTAKSSSDTVLSRELKSAEVIPAESIGAGIQMLAAGKLDVYATNKATLFEMADKVPGSRVLEGNWGMERHALAVPKGRDAGLPYVRAYIADAIAGGLVTTAINRAGMRGAVVASAAAASARAAETACEVLGKLRLPHTEITEARVVAKGEFAPPPGALGGPGAGTLYKALPSFCRVLATLRPSSDSDIKIEVWLPTGGWNRRLEGVGNGAFMSSIFYWNLAEALGQGYAVAATNTGHDGNSGEFAFGHPEKLIDWGYRSVHEMTVTAKAIITARYGNPAKYAYWNSCSTGGREGLMEAENYPDDYDGLAVGDAANPMTRNQASTLFSTLAVNKDPAGFISPAKWLAYRKAVVDECDAADGVKDGLLNNPLACKFDPKAMECKQGNRDDCLTAPQIAALNTVLAGMKNPRTGEQLHPGWPVGANPRPDMVVGHEPEQVAIDTFRALFQKSDWDYHTMDFDKDIARSDRLGNSVMNAADESRLKALFARGGKIFMYHGWSDPNISPLLGIKYYNSAVDTNGGRAQADRSIRLFLVPGMGHCGGGDGPNEFDKMGVITRWVEVGEAPDRIIASHVDAQGQVDRTRPLCPYPQVGKYNGAGSTDEAANFSCAVP
jgi:feruloyl esterase